VNDGPPHRAALDRVDAAVRIVCLLGFVLAVVLTPVRAMWAFALHGMVVGSMAVVVRIPARQLLRRSLVETPFLLFAATLPFIGTGPRTDVLGLSVSVAGLWAAWGIVAKGTLGVTASVLLWWTTPTAALLAGLDRLRVPRVLTAICGFMIRYLEVVGDDLRRLQVARISRGDDPRWLWQARSVASTTGTMFVRSYERGERVHRSMVSRGFTGAFPTTCRRAPLHWWPLCAWPLSSWLIAVVALLGVRP
jgi:cobalt/nickel transport system permease protein